MSDEETAILKIVDQIVELSKTGQNKTIEHLNRTIAAINGDYNVETK